MTWDWDPHLSLECPHLENENDLHFTRVEEQTCKCVSKTLKHSSLICAFFEASLFPALDVLSFVMSFSVHPFPFLLGTTLVQVFIISWQAIFLSFLLLGDLWPLNPLAALVIWLDADATHQISCRKRLSWLISDLVLKIQFSRVSLYHLAHHPPNPSYHVVLLKENMVVLLFRR